MEGADATTKGTLDAPVLSPISPAIPLNFFVPTPLLQMYCMLPFLSLPSYFNSTAATSHHPLPHSSHLVSVRPLFLYLSITPPTPTAAVSLPCCLLSVTQSPSLNHLLLLFLLLMVSSGVTLVTGPESGDKKRPEWYYYTRHSESRCPSLQSCVDIRLVQKGSAEPIAGPLGVGGGVLRGETWVGGGGGSGSEGV
ncbi:unnamed protein product [Pleuronectes platessa]|uniref:Uncharacterized protein n=1 Tax=Pleuronectes platessa TaxID=8262 RepID=A0A9N7ZBP5_PLEPL|nr:unnamed protein product [Pleuronectes platessa]